MNRNPYFQQANQRPQDVRQGYANPQQSGSRQTQYGNDYTQQYAPNGYGDPQYRNQPQYQGGSSAPQGAFIQDDSRSESMTYRDAMNKTAILLAITVVSAIVAVAILPASSYYAAAIVTSLAAFVVGIILAFQRMVKPGLAIAYTVLEGIALGAITVAIDTIYPGVAFQAISATIIIVAVTLGLHYSNAVRTTTRGRKIVLAIAIAGVIFALLNFVLMITGVAEQQWGLRSITVMGIPLGIILGVVMIVVGAYMLIADFEDVNTAVAQKAPKEFAWTCGIAIVMSILWIYVEVLRVAAMLASNDN